MFKVYSKLHEYFSIYINNTGHSVINVHSKHWQLLLSYVNLTYVQEQTPVKRGSGKHYTQEQDMVWFIKIFENWNCRL